MISLELHLESVVEFHSSPQLLFITLFKYCIFPFVFKNWQQLISDDITLFKRN